MSSLVPSHQHRAGFSLTWHPGSLLRDIPFKTIICQQSPSHCLCVYMFKVTICYSVSLCPSLTLVYLPSFRPVSPLVLRSPPHIHITCYSDILLSSQIGCCGFPGVQIQSLTCVRGIRMTGRGEGKPTGWNAAWGIYSMHLYCWEVVRDGDSGKEISR